MVCLLRQQSRTCRVIHHGAQHTGVVALGHDFAEVYLMPQQVRWLYSRNAGRAVADARQTEFIVKELRMEVWTKGGTTRW